MSVKWEKAKTECAIHSMAFSRKKAKYRIWHAWREQFCMIKKEHINEEAWDDFDYLHDAMNFTKQTKEIAEKENIPFESLAKSPIYPPQFIRNMNWKKEEKILEAMENIFLNFKE